jgi:hypothetical protein
MFLEVFIPEGLEACFLEVRILKALHQLCLKRLGSDSIGPGLIELASFI